MWRRVSCEQLLHKSQSILSPRRNPKRMVAVNTRFARRRLCFSRSRSRSEPLSLPLLGGEEEEGIDR